MGNVVNFQEYKRSKEQSEQKIVEGRYWYSNKRGEEWPGFPGAYIFLKPEPPEATK